MQQPRLWTSSRSTSSRPSSNTKNGIVYYFNVGKLESADGEPVEHPEAWYTVQRVWGL
jgi:hypothetical protein